MGFIKRIFGLFKTKPIEKTNKKVLKVRLMGIGSDIYNVGDIIKYKVLDEYEHPYVYLDLRPTSKNYECVLNKWAEHDDAEIINIKLNVI